MIFTPEERRAILAVAGLLLVGQAIGMWRSWRAARPDAELNRWLSEWHAARDEAIAEGARVAPAWAAPPLTVEPIEQAPPGWVESGNIYLDRADARQLQQLPGIGPALAGRIVAAREVEPFRRVEDLLRVAGIGERTLDRLRPFVAFSPDAGRDEPQPQSKSPTRSRPVPDPDSSRVETKTDSGREAPPAEVESSFNTLNPSGN